MPQYIKKIRTGSGDLQIDYEALANLPKLGALASKDKIEKADLAEDVQEVLNKTPDTTLTQEGQAADAKAVGDALANISSGTQVQIITWEDDD